MSTAVAAYTRVSIERQAEQQTIKQQLERVRAYAAQHGWPLDGAARGEVDRLLVTSPDRLARWYAYQVWLLEEFERAGCAVVFLDRPPSDDPQDALLLQIRGAVAEYERTVIADRMRRGRLAALRAGRLLPWCRPVGFQNDDRVQRVAGGGAHGRQRPDQGDTERGASRRVAHETTGKDVWTQCESSGENVAVGRTRPYRMRGRSGEGPGSQAAVFVDQAAQPRTADDLSARH